MAENDWFRRNAALVAFAKRSGGRLIEKLFAFAAVRLVLAFIGANNCQELANWQEESWGENPMR